MPKKIVRLTRRLGDSLLACFSPKREKESRVRRHNDIPRLAIAMINKSKPPAIN